MPRDMVFTGLLLLLRLPLVLSTLFGGAFPHSSMVLALDHLSDDQLTAILEPLSVARITIGQSDYSPKPRWAGDDWTKQGRQGDFQLPFLQRVSKVRPDLRFIATPWAPPQKFLFEEGPSFNPGETDTYASNIAGWVNWYRGQGVAIEYLSVQNEPQFYTPMYPSLKLPANLAYGIIKSLKTTAGLDSGVQILGFDHNPDSGGLQYCKDLLSMDSAGYISGMAFHLYGGNVPDISSLKGILGNRSVWMTEGTASVGDDPVSSKLWWTDRLKEFKGLGPNFEGFVYWSSILDTNGGPDLRTDGYQMVPMATVFANNNSYQTTWVHDLFSEWSETKNKVF